MTLASNPAARQLDVTNRIAKLTTGKHLRIFVETNAEDFSEMTLKPPRDRAGRYIPDIYGLVSSTTCKFGVVVRTINQQV